MYIGEARKVQEAAAKMIEEGRTQLRNNRRPRWKEYTLIKYKDNKIESIEKTWINESVIFPSIEDYFWKPEEGMIRKPVA